jgi:para-aminobenzoate synthetase
MVITHLPSSLFLAFLPLARTLPLTILFLVLRSAMSSMDQAPRSAFLASVVLPQERTAVMGTVNVLKTLSQSAGPSVTGVLAGEGRFWVAFVVAGGLKAGYDGLLLGMFGGRRGEGRVRDGEGECQEEGETRADVERGGVVEGP